MTFSVHEGDGLAKWMLALGVTLAVVNFAIASKCIEEINQRTRRFGCWIASSQFASHLGF